MRLLVVSYFFPPFNNMGAVRVGKTAKYLMKTFGHDVRVVTAASQPFQATLPPELPADRVTYTKWFNVNKPAEILSGGRARVTAAGHELQGPTEFVRAARSFYRDFYKSVVAFPDDQIGWYPFALRAASRLMADWRPDLLLASGPPNTSLLAVYRLAQRYDIPWVAELRDLWTDSHYYRFPRWRQRLEQRLERRVLGSASGFLTVSEPLAEVLRLKYRAPVAVVLNGYDPEDYPASAGGLLEKKFVRLVYTGMLMWSGVEGGMDPRPLFEALRRLGPLAEHIRLAFYGRRLQGARDAARTEGVEHLVEVHDQVPYLESLRMQREADVLLLFLWNDPKEPGVYTGKLFEYIGAGRPILAVGSADNVAAQLIRDRRAGVVLNDPARIAERLLQWVEQKQNTGSIPALSPESAAGLSREEQTAHIHRFLSRLVTA
jgi:hypothetical protein